MHQIVRLQTHNTSCNSLPHPSRHHPEDIPRGSLGPVVSNGTRLFRPDRLLSLSRSRQLPGTASPTQLSTTRVFKSPHQSLHNCFQLSVRLLPIHLYLLVGQHPLSTSASLPPAPRSSPPLFNLTPLNLNTYQSKSLARQTRYKRNTIRYTGPK